MALFVLFVFLSVIGDAALIYKGNRKLGLCFLSVFVLLALIVNALFFVKVICLRGRTPDGELIEITMLTAMLELLITLLYFFYKACKYLIHKIHD